MPAPSFESNNLDDKEEIIRRLENRIRELSINEDYMTDERPITRRATKIEWTLLFALFMQAAALIWGAAKLTTGVENLTTKMDQMSDYSVLRYRLQLVEESLRKLESQHK